MQLPVRLSTLLLAVLGLAMLALGIWVEDRAAVAAPLVIIGALLVMAAVIVETWADIEELSLSQSGVSFKRRAPSAEQLAEQGLPPQVAEALDQWLNDVTRLLPREIDKRVSAALVRRPYTSRRARLTEQEIREEALRRIREDYTPEPGPGAATTEPDREPPKPGPGAA